MSDQLGINGNTKKRTNQTAKFSANFVEKRQPFEKRRWTTNPGDRIISKSQTLEEKSKQLAVNAPDITGDHIEVPTYFIVQYPSGEKKALHHVRDAEEISNVIRQARFDEENWIQQSVGVRQNFNLSGLVFVVALLLITVPILIGIF